MAQGRVPSSTFEKIALNVIAYFPLVMSDNFRTVNQPIFFFHSLGFIFAVQKVDTDDAGRLKMRQMPILKDFGARRKIGKNFFFHPDS